MSLYQRQTFRTHAPDVGRVADRETVYTGGKNSWGDGVILFSRATLIVKTENWEIDNQFRTDCGALGVTVNRGQGMGKRRGKGKRSLSRLTAYSCSGPSQSLEMLSRKDYIDRVGGHFKGRMLEDVAIPRPAVQTGYARDGFVNQRREPPVPREARRVVRPNLPNVGTGKPPVDAKGNRDYSHPLPNASEFTEPMAAAERVIVKMGKMGAQTKEGRALTAEQVQKQNNAGKLSRAQKWAARK